jgi:mevalonate kinase
VHLALWVLLVRARAGEAAAVVVAVVAARGELGGDNMELQTEEKVEDEMEKRVRGAAR